MGMTQTSYESWETRRDSSLQRKASKASAAITEVQTKLTEQESGLNEALTQAQQALDIVSDPEGPVQQAISESAAARDAAQDAVTAVDAATDDIADALATADEAVLQASHAVTTADGKNKIYRIKDSAEIPPESELNAGDLLFFLNPATFGTSFEEVFYVYIWNGTAWGINRLTASSVLVPSSVGTISLADGAVTAPKILAGAVIAEKIQAGAVDATKLQAGAVTTEKLDAGSVTASKLVIGDNTNLVSDPLFQKPVGESWTGSTEWMTREFSGYDGRGVIINGSGTGGGAREIYSAGFSVSPGDDLLIRARTYQSDTFDGAASIGIKFYDGGGSELSVHTTTGTDNVWTVAVVTQTVPSGARTAKFRSAIAGAADGQFAFTEPQVLRRASGELIVDGSITAGKIQAGAITAPKIQAGAVNASKMTIGDITNLLDDPGFNNVENDTWALGSNASIVTSSKGNTLQLTANDAWTPSYNNNTFSVKEGEKLQFVGTTWNNTDKAGRLDIIWYDDSGQLSSKNWGGIAAESGWVDRTFEATAPAGATKGRFAVRLSGSTSGSGRRLLVFQPRLLRKITGELIVNGAVTADAIAANSIDASHIKADAITASELKADSIYTGHLRSDAVTASKIAANAVTAGAIKADAIDGKTITGATIQSKSPSGGKYPARSVVMTPNGIDVFGSDGTQVSRIDYRGLYTVANGSSGMYAVSPTYSGKAHRTSAGTVTVTGVFTSGTPVVVSGAERCVAHVTARSGSTITIKIDRAESGYFVSDYDAYWIAVI